MFAITGVTGKVGGGVARGLLKEGKKVRAVVRSAAKGEPWAALGCEVVVAEVQHAEALAKAFHGMEGVFLMTPPNYDPEPGFPDTVAMVNAVERALIDARPGKVVLLSTVGAQVQEMNLLNNSGLTEAMLRRIGLPVALLRAAWFMENAAWDVEAAKAGTIASFLQPLEHAIPMVATADIASTAVALLGERWEGVRVVELEGPRRYSANDVGAGFGAALGRTVRMEVVPRETWEGLFRGQGMRHPEPRIRMLDGFNEGWIDFEGAGAESRKGRTTLESVLRQLVQDA